MLSPLRSLATDAYERLLRWELSGTPNHVAVIQDGNRRYARSQGADATDGHRAGAQTTEDVLNWCDELGIEELTLYTFSTENFDRPPEQLEELFDLIEQKLREFADTDRVHDSGVCIRAIGEIDRLPERVQDAVAYAEGRTREYDQFTLNIALAYGGRAELLSAARDIATRVDADELDADAVDVDTVEQCLYEGATRDVDLIIRTGGDERTSNFLPWHANGNEAAVYFCAPYWPEFRKIDFLRAIRTYESREESWRETKTRRALALVRALENDRADVGAVRERLAERLPSDESGTLREETEFDQPAD
ncbi:polyprenyl diphosphate synthase [Halapricum salinum]|uniref:Tritrans,polycis-undecaprenyl-diphosphate synthase (geranylgeranyl-diphosphate specific) n=1 Tax=Halapricum salinum TaxID=1457250 RepID=A0A4D6HFZ6_9EURY|nr:polyprenyl diphosphate synthase [Halapricum salinum]QCC52166.1 di-trans,poly-cis-decaprenylcistransferase [Halapricum salinum]